MKNDDVQHEALGERMDRAMDQAFIEAVLRHRAANVPMVFQERGAVRHVSPFDITLPGEALPPADPPRRRAAG
jgi:hypothetical protein